LKGFSFISVPNSCFFICRNRSIVHPWLWML
jgi:hypothetical protein